jgi:hypothetical protein
MLMLNTVPHSIGGDEGEGTSYIVLGTDVAGVGFNLIGEEFGEVDAWSGY